MNVANYEDKFSFYLSVKTHLFFLIYEILKMELVFI